MADIRAKAKADKVPSLKPSWLVSVRPIVDILNKRTKQLSLKDIPFIVKEPGEDNKIRLFEKQIRMSEEDIVFPLLHKPPLDWRDGLVSYCLKRVNVYESTCPTLARSCAQKDETSTSVAESANNDRNKPLTIVDVDKVVTDFGDKETLIKLIPPVVEAKENYEYGFNFNQLISAQSFPMDNTAFLLFLDVVRWYDTKSTTAMRYEDTAVHKIWHTGYKMFHSKWLRYTSCPKTQEI
ncbi:unnamed protein product [Mytilus coruscus]|uniref:Uncharacterized protein n=1 Tax=Mytilus coruscus TaxID=42192 RepID=A0A6J8BLI6_MYTCO|nr:unnamed protein product [Mytilus coruscus]